ncbi:hypothetical protein GCM10010964_27370 [Caldovatus sediminis]|uniref:Peptidase inhibitor I78 n=2 Tax=Caldovatus sediminis TaxID=2041189 RepID=A0A8J3EE92_9PROT|nr:hypothetical protein GCM10010964_27370 [Caldovatus sediminis]
MLASGAACATGDAAPPASPEAACARLAATRTDLLGRPWETARGRLAPPARGRLRVLRPGEAATMEFDPRRLNVHLDRDGRVIRLSCG